MRCAATGMSASVTFQPDAVVRGAVSRLQGHGTAKIATIDGRWTDVVEVTAPEWEARGERHTQPSSDSHSTAALRGSVMRAVTQPAVCTHELLEDDAACTADGGLFEIFVRQQASCSTERRTARRPCTACGCRGCILCGCHTSGAPFVTPC